ncbi:MAG: ABC transporter ATP-binding protein [Candidatus Thorarchaeota archaeon]
MALELNQKNTILQLKNISKAFPGVQANDNINLKIYQGEILAILGENGAGKSTLMKILSGLYQPDSGTILIDSDWFQGKETTNNLIEFRITNPRVSLNIGIGMVHQHFKLVETMSVVENIVLGKEFTYGVTPFLNKKVANREITTLGQRYGLPINPEAIIEDLPVGIRQRVEILRQLYRQAQLLILDEPTAVLTPDEVKELFKTIRELKSSGKTVIFISHKLKEPIAIADRIVVMRKGQIIGEVLPMEATEESLAEMMVGRRILLRMQRKEIARGNPVLKLENFSIKDLRFKKSKTIDSDLESRFIVNKATFQIHEHEIVGIAGVQGNGQTELVEGLFSLRPGVSGSAKYSSGKTDKKEIELVGKSTLKILEEGIAYIPEDRSTQGLIQEFPVYENTWLSYPTQPDRAESYLGERKTVSFKDKLLYPISLIKDFAGKVVKDYDIATPNIYVLLKNLSGGNQQKVILGREFAKNPRLIIASQPTRGVDIGVTEKVRNTLLAMRDQGAGILLVSSDLDEVLALSDYILVMYEGSIVGQGPIEEFPLKRISHLMTTGLEL